MAARFRIGTKGARSWFRSLVAELIGVQGDVQVWWTPELPLIYVSNAKSGCSTIKNSLRNAQAHAFRQAGSTFNNKLNPHVGDDCLRNSGLSIRPHPARFLISSVRNPFSRALSAYLDMVDGRDVRQYPELKRWNVATFEDLLREAVVRRPRTLNVHFRPQYINLDIPNVHYDAILYLENLAALPVLLKEVMGNFQLTTFAPHARGATSKLGLHYTPHAIELVRQIYAKDFDYFGYSRDISDAQSAPGAYIGESGVVGFGNERALDAPAGGAAALAPILRFQRLVEWKLI